MPQKDFHPPPGQNEPTLPGEQKPGQPMPQPQHVPTGEQQEVPLGQQHEIPHSQQTMPQQYMPTNQQPMPQQYMPTNQQPMPQQWYAPPGQQPMPQQQYVPAGQAMPQQQYEQQMPRQYYQQQPQPQYNQQMPGQQYPVGAQPMQGPFGGQSPSPFLSVPLQPWSSELFDCAQDVENCIITTFFPCITFGQIAEITDRGMTSCAASGLIYGLLLYFTGFHWVYSWMYRTRLRASYSLAEDPCHDCLVHAFCDPCALCQEYRELKNRGFNMEIGWIGNMQMQSQKATAEGVPPPVQGMTR